MSKDDFKDVGMGQTKAELLAHLESQSQVLQDVRVKNAFLKVDRAHFISPDYSIEAYEDYALPIGYEQTISQPTTVAFMLELLEVVEGNSVLDIGSGSGWTTALLAEIVGPEGSVLGLEIIPELVEQGNVNLERYDYPNVTIEHAGTELGVERDQTYDRILVSADVEEVPQALIGQLADHGIMVIPVGGAIYKLKKIGEEIQEMRFPGFAFPTLK